MLVESRQEGFNVYNIGSGQSYSVRQIVDLCEEIIGKKIFVEQRSDLLRKSERMNLCASIEKIRTATAWEPKIELKQTLHDLLV